MRNDQTPVIETVGVASALIQTKAPAGPDGGPPSQSLGVIATALETEE